MPRESATFEWRPLVRDGRDFQYIVEKLKRPYFKLGVKTNARIIRCNMDGKERTEPSYNARQKAYRTDLQVDIPALGATGRWAFFHRVVAFAWHPNKVQEEGGSWRDLYTTKRKTWHNFDPYLYEVDHGQNGPGEVFIENLSIVTPARNKELERERKGLKRRRLK